MLSSTLKVDRNTRSTGAGPPRDRPITRARNQRLERVRRRSPACHFGSSSCEASPFCSLLQLWSVDLSVAPRHVVWSEFWYASL